MSKIMDISGESKFSLVSKARLKFDQVRNAELLLLPERVVKLNGSAAAILKLLDGNRSVREVTETLQDAHKEFDVSDDVLEFLRDALEKGWIR